MNVTGNKIHLVETSCSQYNWKGSYYQIVALQHFDYNA